MPCICKTVNYRDILLILLYFHITAILHDVNYSELVGYYEWRNAPHVNFETIFTFHRSMINQFVDKVCLEVFFPEKSSTLGHSKILYSSECLAKGQFVYLVKRGP